MFPRSLVSLAGVFLVSAVSMYALTVERLRVEYLDNPIGLDVARPRLSWVLDSTERAQRQSAYQIRVATSPEALAAGRAEVWDSGKIVSAENFGIEFAGSALRSGTRCFWQVRVWDAADRPSEWSRISWWQMGPMQTSDWTAEWIGADASAGSPLLRDEFNVEKKIVRATAHAYAIGWYRLFLNGSEISERVLSPVNSNYPKGLFFDSYDVTPLLRSGANAIGVWLGNGYSQNYSKWGYRWDRPLAALVQLEILLDDGSTQTVVSNGDWKWSESPVVANDIYNGETYDARREVAGWSRAAFDEREWKNVARRDAPAGPLLACPFPGVAVSSEIRAVKITELRPGTHIFDFGQNFAGWTRLTVRGPAGTQVVIRHAEDLHPDGTLDVTTNRAARATDTYILAGGGEETYEPRFTYHGFRYVEVTGFPGQPTAENVVGRVVYAAAEDAGSFRCSDAFLNRLHSNFRWSIASNLYGIPTDTPTRDERTPCQMDSLAVEDAAICNFDLAAYYTKWLHDISGDGGNLPNWTGDQVVLPFVLYENYGDRRILERHFANMKQVVDKFTADAVSSKHWAGAFGDWCAPNPDGSYEGSFSEGELVNTAFHFRCARIVADVAALLGESSDAARYSELAAKIRDEFNAKFYRPETKTYGSGRQVTSVLPLAFGLVQSAHRRDVAEALRRRIEDVDRSHLDTGIFGTRYLFEVLIDHGYPELAHRVLTGPGYPGYADQIARGATTTWEQWAFKGSMQTHNHAMFSGPDATLFSRLGGIQCAAPGFREILIRPAMPAGLSFVECSRMTPMGKVSNHWSRSGNALTLRVTIPANSTAEIHIPAPNLAAVTESGKPVQQAAGILDARAGDGVVIVKVGSGGYSFRAD